MEAIKTKRIRRDPDTTRGLILDATERVMVSEGYAAVSSRRIADEVGVNPATIHYYYATTDDLFIALHERMTRQQLAELERVLAAANPLQALWDYQSNWSQSALGVEFIAVSNHRKNIQKVLAATTDDARGSQAGVLERAIANSGVDTSIVSPLALTTMLVAIARTLANEERVGIVRGHEEVRAFVAMVLARLTRRGADQAGTSST